jgi:uncharacterized protein
MSDLGRTPVPQKTFMTRVNALKGKGHVAILSSGRRGWVMFSENLIRGYVRLVAEGTGVRLALEHEPAPAPKALTVGPIDAASTRQHLAKLRILGQGLG